MAEPQPDHYDIGWICALGTELTASRLFFNSIYEAKLPLAENDSNTYVRGRMGEHNVVIAVLPVGSTGTNAAATTTNNIVRSYRNLKVVLMVGIGGGAPTVKNDIRLGDVVISAKSGQYGAVMQYDLGRQHQGRGFEPTGFLSLPPTSISTVANVVKSNHDLDKTNSLTTKIDAALATRSKLRWIYGRPGEATDVLFKSDYVHVGHDTCDDCDTTQAVRRRVRDDDEQGPQAHYGLIASANLVMRDAKFRDTLAKEKGVLCFEMEAAGMMNNCPCLVIRGICDYSDSHKNKQWQGYAAMVAAAYAKELLLQLEPQEMARDQTIAQALTDGQLLITQHKSHFVFFLTIEIQYQML
ncbi:pfs domain-containing protein [Colletotrichum sojae]|uniref:Pfs domain-containing protein n=1 Tax=Colletotrichum sojae TaxID=2175907 RepID=A0A8H6IUV9_9PEZI|nr:pfs domain-containing protein [Colletotrichum sojae]